MLPQERRVQDSPGGPTTDWRRWQRRFCRGGSFWPWKNETNDGFTDLAR